MSIELFGLVILVVGGLCLVRGQGSTAVVFIVLTVFGSAAAAFIGQNTIPPAHVFLAFLAAAVLVRGEARLSIGAALRPSEPGFWLTCLVAYGVIGAVLLPRVLAGLTQIVPLGVTEFGEITGAVPLVPGSSNITQSIYLISNLLCFLLIVAVASRADGFRAVVVGLIAYGLANAAFALVDLATYATGTQDALQFMRNAKYTLHNEEEVSGLKRIVGSFTETSSFARSSLGVLGFAGTLWLCGRYARLTGPLALATVVLLVLSTSSTAIVGIPVVIAILYLASWYVALTKGGMLSWAFVIGLPVVLLVATTAVLLEPQASRAVTDYLNTTVFNKLGTDSGIERSSWNTYALQNVWDTWGAGVGVGTTRTSSFFLALISSTGVLGLIFYGAFAYGAFVRPRGVPRSFEADARMACLNACIGLLVGDLLLSPSIDQGLLFFVLAGLAAAVPARSAAPYPDASASWRPA